MSDFKAKRHKIRFRLGFPPRRSQPLTGFLELLIRREVGNITGREGRENEGSKL